MKNTPKAAAKAVAAPEVASTDTFEATLEAKLREIAAATAALERLQQEFEQMVQGAIIAGSSAPRVA